MNMKGQIMSLITSSGILPTLKTRIPRHDENHVREITVFQTKDFSIFMSMYWRMGYDNLRLKL